MVWSLRDVFPTVFFFVLNKFSSQRFLALRSNGILEFHFILVRVKGDLGSVASLDPFPDLFFFFFLFFLWSMLDNGARLGSL